MQQASHVQRCCKISKLPVMWCATAQLLMQAKVLMNDPDRFEGLCRNVFGTDDMAGANIAATEHFASMHIQFVAASCAWSVHTEVLESPLVIARLLMRSCIGPVWVQSCLSFEQCAFMLSYAV